MRRVCDKDKAIKTSVSLPEGMLDSAKHVASKKFGGNLSAYVQRLIENDLKGIAPEARGGDILESLTRRFRPALLSKMRDALAGADQQLVLDNLLEQIIHALEEDPSADPLLLRVVSYELSVQFINTLKPAALDRVCRKAFRDAGLAYPDDGMEDYIAKRLPECVQKAKLRIVK